jgi:hypothetical protein
VTDLFPIDDGELKVLSVISNGFVPIEPPEGVTPLSFRTVVSAIHTYYLHEGTVPDFDELLGLYQRIRKDVLLKCWESPELKQALGHRGVEWLSDGGLTIQQEHTIMALSDPTDKRSQGAILRNIGVSPTTFRTWMKSSLFNHRLNQASVANYHDFLPMARNALISEALDGKMPAIELLFQLTGEWSPETEAVGDLRAVVQTLVESIVRNVRDDETKRAILADGEAALASLRLTKQTSRALER